MSLNLRLGLALGHKKKMATLGPILAPQSSYEDRFGFNIVTLLLTRAGGPKNKMFYLSCMTMVLILYGNSEKVRTSGASC